MNTKEKYNVIIVDDEYLAQKLLQDYVSKVESLQLVATCSNAIEAMNVLKDHQVDIMFLDIQMPDLTGLDLAKSLEHRPLFRICSRCFQSLGGRLSAQTVRLSPFHPSHQQGHWYRTAKGDGRSEARS